MADERKIVIELKLNNGDGDDGDSKSGDSYNLSKALNVAQHPIKAAENAVLGKNELLAYAYNRGKQLLKSQVKFQIGMYFNLTENYKAEQDLENTLSVLNNVSDSVGSIFAGMIAGSKFGPVGLAVGATAGMGVAAGTTILNALHAFAQQNIQLTTMNMQSSYQRVKLGLIDDGRGTQN